MPQISIDASANDVNAPAANTAAVVTYAADTNQRHVITGIAWSYSAAPTGGNIKVEDGGGNVVFQLDIPTAGWDSIVFPIPKRGVNINTAMIVTLAAGGAAVVGKVSVLGHYVE